MTKDENLNGAIQTFDKQERDANLDAIKERILANFENEEDPENEALLKEVGTIINTLIKDEVRRLIADEKNSSRRS